MGATHVSAPKNDALAFEVDRVHARIVAELRGAGVGLSEDVLTSIAEVVLTDAIRLALAWSEG